MKQVIGGLVYDTEKAEAVHEHDTPLHGVGGRRKEILYRTPNGRFFMYENDRFTEHERYLGDASESIEPLSDIDRVREWLEEVQAPLEVYERAGIELEDA